MARYIETKGLPIHRLLRLALKEGNSKKPIYQMHKWWARRLSSVFRAILIASVIEDRTTEDDFMRQFSEESELGKDHVVYDPFAGGGTTLVEAQRLGFDIFGCEIDPVAWYVTRQELTYTNVKDLDAAFEEVRRYAASKILTLFRTTNEEGKETDLVYAFWVSVVKCPSCSFDIELHPHYQLYRNRRAGTKTVFCSRCHSVQSISLDAISFSCLESCCLATTNTDQGNITSRDISCPNCRNQWKRTIINSLDKPLKRRLFAVEYLDLDDAGRCVTKFKRASLEDQERFRKAETEWSHRINDVSWMHPFLSADIPQTGRKDPRPINYGFKRYSQLFNARQLLALSYVGEAVNKLPDSPAKDLICLALSDSLATNNMLCSYAFDYKKLTPLFGLHGYQVITRPVENNVWGTHRGRGSFSSCYRKVYRGMLSKQTLPSGQGSNSHANHLSDRRVQFERRDARKIDFADETVDLVITDPPYFDNLQYGELSDFFFAWLRPWQVRRFPKEMEPINCLEISGNLAAKRNSSKDQIAFAEGLSDVFQECYRVLKANGLLVFTFHHNNGSAWDAVGEALRKSGFQVINVVPIRSEGRSGFHSSPGNLRWDAILVCRKSESLTGENKRTLLLNIDSTLEDWKRALDDIDGAPSEVDWQSLRRALEISNSVGVVA